MTEKGLGKLHNQDRLLIRYGDYGSGFCVLLAVADGVGGLAGGETASKIAVEKLNQWWDASIGNMYCDSPGSVKYHISENLDAVVQDINAALFSVGRETGRKMGTTLSILFIMDDWYCIKHVGDSRIYLISEELQQLTEDDSLLNKYLKSGEQRLSTECYHTLANTLTNCLGVRSDTALFESKGRMLEGEGFLLCTDGFYKRIRLDERLKCVRSCKSWTLRGKGFLRRILRRARLRGEVDDITVIVLVGS